jgi:hypothetical protein
VYLHVYPSSKDNRHQRARYSVSPTTIIPTMTDSTPESTLPYPPIHKDKKFVVLSDWLVSFHVKSRLIVTDSGIARDGTITTYDSNDCGSSRLTDVDIFID